MRANHCSAAVWASCSGFAVADRRPADIARTPRSLMIRVMCLVFIFLGLVYFRWRESSRTLRTLRSILTATSFYAWPFPSAGFVLESTTSLSLTNWQSAAELATTNNNRLEVTVSLDRSQRFF